MGYVVLVGLLVGAVACGAWIGWWAGREHTLRQVSGLPKFEIWIDRKIIDPALAAVGYVAVPAEEWIAARRALIREVEAEMQQEGH